MTNLHNDFNRALDLVIESKIKEYEETFNEKIIELEKLIETQLTNPHKEILQQKEVLELLGIGRRRLKNWVDRGLSELRVDNRVYYRYSELIQFIENNGN